MSFHEETMNKLPFVRWDRFTRVKDATGEYDEIHAFGWIDRDDGRADFVTVEMREYDEAVGWFSSSAAHHDEINTLLGCDPGSSIDCERVEDVFPGVTNAIRIKEEALEFWTDVIVDPDSEAHRHGEATL